MTVFHLDFKRRIGELISWTLVVGAIVAIVMMLYSMFGSVFRPETFSARLDALPSLIREIMGLSDYPDLSEVYQFTAYFFQYVVLLSCFYGGIIGAKALTGEEGKGTIEFLYAQPITRGSIFRQKLFSAILRYLIYSVLIYVITCLMIMMLNPGMNISGIAIDLFRVLIALLYAGYVFMAVGILLSALFRSNAESISVIMALILITYIIGLMGDILNKFSFLRYLSPVQHVLPLTVLNNGFGLVGLTLGVIVFIVAIVLGALRYKKKDFLV